MAPKRKKKTVRYKTRSARIRRTRSHSLRAVISFVILVFVVAAAGVLAHHFLDEKATLQSTKTVSAAPKRNNHDLSVRPPVYEIFPRKERLFPVNKAIQIDEAKRVDKAIRVDKVNRDDEINRKRNEPLLSKDEKQLARRTVPNQKPTRPLSKAGKLSLPIVAIIIDDIGYDPRLVDLFLSIDVPLTFSVLPFSPFQKKVTGKIAKKNHEIMLHLPMEPVEYPQVNPGPGALLSSMSPRQLTNHLNRAIDAVPGAVGVNNHMGSRLTTDAEQMYRILKSIKGRGMYYIDSRTSYQSVSHDLARRIQLPFAQRKIFLDNDTDPAKITTQLNKLIRYAQRHGEAVGIGHPHKETFQVLSKKLPELINQIRFVPASHIARIPG